MNKRVLITGATGLLGRALMDTFVGLPDLEIMGLGHHRSAPGIRTLDLLDSGALNSLLEETIPGIIIHAAAERRPDVGESNPESMRRLNVDVTRELAHYCKRSGAWILYISTDYVFDGSSPPYKPEDSPHPLNLYGQSKRDGEIAVQSLTIENLVLRVPILYGRVESLQESPITIIAQDLLNGRRGKIDNWAVRYPTHVNDVASVCRKLVELQLRQGVSGVYHWSGDEAFTKYQMALVIAEIVQTDPHLLIPDDQPASGAPRPRDSHLDCTVLESMGIGRRIPFSQGIREALAPFLM